MFMQAQVLSNEEKKMIHTDSIRILEDVGVKFPSEKALGILETGGARIDWDKKIAYISESMVNKALISTPKEFTLGARDPANNFTMPSAYSAYTLDGCGVNMLDFETGKRRAATLRDVAESARIFDEIELGMIHWPPISPCDVPKGLKNIVNAGVSFMNTSKHVADDVKTHEEVYYIMEMAKAILGSAEEVKKRKIYSVTYCSVAPLSHDQAMLEATMEIAEYGAPILLYPMPACGSTGPASLYSNIAMANAESLSSLVLFQLATPGTPLIYGAALGTINMRSGMFLEGAAETILQLTAMGEMGKYYKMPTIIAGCLTDAKEPGMQSVLEKFMTTLPLVLAGVDVVQGIGLIESSMTLSYEHIIIDGEIADICSRIRKGVDAAEAKNYFEDIKAVGPEGHFLKQRSTRTAFRSSEFYTPSLCDQNTYEEWIALGNPDMFSKAREKVKKILASEPKNPLNTDTEKALNEIMDEAKAKITQG
jgi:trimethylamine---corrinoid protein Co-methyltransferase